MLEVKAHKFTMMLRHLDRVMIEVNMLHHFGDLDSEFRQEFIRLRRKVVDYVEVDSVLTDTGAAAN